jgi:hypothetical protein
MNICRFENCQVPCLAFGSRPHFNLSHRHHLHAACPHHLHHLTARLATGAASSPGHQSRLAQSSTLLDQPPSVTSSPSTASSPPAPRGSPPIRWLRWSRELQRTLTKLRWCRLHLCLHSPPSATTVQSLHHRCHRRPTPPLSTHQQG